VPASGATTGRGLGVLEMARALRAGVPHRAQGEIAAHVLDIMVGIETAIAENSIVEIDSRLTEGEPMPADFDPFAETLATAPAGAGRAASRAPPSVGAGALVARERARVLAAAARLALVQVADPRALVVGELQLERGEVRDDPFGGDGLRDHHVAQRQVPADHH